MAKKDLELGYEGEMHLGKIKRKIRKVEEDLPRKFLELPTCQLYKKLFYYQIEVKKWSLGMNLFYSKNV